MFLATEVVFFFAPKSSEWKQTKLMTEIGKMVDVFQFPACAICVVSIFCCLYQHEVKVLCFLKI